MYERYYGLTERPFDLTPNPRYLFLSTKHREALSHLQYGISGGKGITLLIGDAGTGKTTLVHAALEQQRGQKAGSVYLSNPMLTRSEFFEFLAWGFGLDAAAETSKTRFLLELTRTLTERQAERGASALIIDEAQCLPQELLEEIRLLANIETAVDKLLPVVLVGQPEFADRLNEPSLRQLKQRVALRCVLPPLDAAGNGGLHREPHQRGRWSRRPAVHRRRDSGHLRARARHPAHDQRDLRQRARVRICHRRASRRAPDGAGSVPRLRSASGRAAGSLHRAGAPPGAAGAARDSSFF